MINRGYSYSIISEIMKKVVFSVLFIGLFLLGLGFAHEELPDPGITPDSFLYNLDLILDRISLLLTFDSGDKAMKGLEIARERLAEVKAMVEANKLEAAERASLEHGSILESIRTSSQALERRNATQHITEIIEIERELEEHEDEVESVEQELEIKIKIKGELTQELQEFIELILSSAQNMTGDVKVDIEAKKEEIKVKIKQQTGMNESEIEEKVEDLEEKLGLAEIKIEKTMGRIEEASERIKDVEQKLAELNITIRNVDVLITEAKEKLAKANESLSQKDFGEAFGQATAANALAENANRILEKHLEELEGIKEEEEPEIEVKIDGGIARIKVNFGSLRLNYVLLTTDIEEILANLSEKTGLTIEELKKLLELETEEEFECLVDADCDEDEICVENVCVTTTTTIIPTTTTVPGTTTTTVSITTTTLPLTGKSALLLLTPSSKTVNVGDTFPVEIRLNTNSQVVAVSAYLNFDTTKLEAVSIDSTNSVFSVKAEEKILGDQIMIGRGQQTPGVTSNVLVAKVNFRAKVSGTANVNFVLTSLGQGPSRVILDDGLGTDILTSVTNGVYAIT